MGLFHDEGTRRWPVSRGPDLIFPVPRDRTGDIYLYFTELYEPFGTLMWNGEAASSPARSKLEIFFRRAEAHRTCPRATREIRRPCTTSGEKFAFTLADASVPHKGTRDAISFHRY